MRGMKNKERIMLISATLASILWLSGACDKTDNSFGKNRWQTAGGRGENEKEESNDTTIYVSGVAFPDGYDWKRDTLHGEIDCRLVLLRNGKRIVDLPARLDRQVSSDPDMHRIVDGHLYTEFSSDSVTLIGKDGRTLFSYRGREMISGLMVRPDGVYTLGSDRDGNGFSYRKDGQVIMKKDTGIVYGGMYGISRPTGALYEENGHLYFTYYTVFRSAGRTIRHYYTVEDANETEIEFPMKSVGLYDIQVIKDELYFLLNRYSDFSTLALVCGKDYKDIVPNSVASASNARIVADGTVIYVVSDLVSKNSRHYYTSVWREDEGEKTFPGKTEILIANGTVCAMEKNADGKVRKASCGDKSFSIEGDYALMTRNCAAYSGGRLFLALTPSEIGKSPVLWFNGIGKEISEIKNGFVTGVSVVLPRNGS